MSRRRRIVIIEEGESGAIFDGNEASLTGPDAEISIVFDDAVYSEAEADAALEAAAETCTT